LNNNDGNLYLTNPPLRDGKELMRLRRSFHLVDTIASDHCPFMIEDKMKYEKAYQVPKGLDGLEYTFPLMFNLFGDQVISKYTSKPAELFGLKNKGEIRVGKDGDAVIFDNTLSNTIRESHSKSDYTVYEGLKIRGKITTTISRGQVIMSDDVYYGGKGQYLRRG
jgi:dihydropyrimidinase